MKALREKHLTDNLSYFNDCKTSFGINECKSWINKIFDDVEAELEALQSRSCEGCKYFNSSINRGLCFRLDIAVSKTFCCQGYEPKEQL